ncbi:molybdopterin molybdenumtransferase MoeA [Roseobacter sp. HKCCD9010]|uniref:molybdopterin molybdotransferase MoeA n=1 Tax=unclassified Roseobacter TaxID=196798 RepID=UPI0014909A5F|nr:molybdopterin molybdenumtransferase MoeA [Rhodobacterales bacterium HKCCD4356]NNV12326.1 molybdopterin molybdenumtransferase MoeA [Roseobacter sp. HKCCD7357]NNV16211.1 molybdopterin molybdenumtransferase MoeA [Roseobacter sp. HKCCD8768]NNV25671.1 molybdopterin molybdenumtransferase MoeA [Roseobacter sp. HKCCD8192]NNV29927.1 molybdopterin molybdenumtransferase MoeA [Roseobacter sp. HKCCD9061]NNV34257.1 molybdopterin molybdenumtransferase MoeA [Roseobacter sp. HKCCD9073]NNV38506.1 molybdopte
MITVAEALAQCLALTRVLEVEDVPLAEAAGRVLARSVLAERDQPPFAASAMDGYAVRSDEAAPGAQFRVIGEAAAGHVWHGQIGAGEALRIFTGAPVPEGADRIIIQEDVTRDDERITLGDKLDQKTHIRPSGGDFRKGHRIEAPRRLSPADIALAASMNHATLPVTRRPEVALIATGDELVQPGETPRPDQIIASNTYGLKALIEAEGGHARMLPIARDTRESLEHVLGLAAGADLIVTIGGASVGDHDLVGEVAAAMGLERSFYKIAMRPGKPLMAGRLARSALVGLPGNPVSSMVCGHLFIVPMLHAFLGLPTGERRLTHARLAVDLPANGPREHYMRARLIPGNGLPEITPLDAQDSSLLTRLADADALLVRPPHQEPQTAGAIVEALLI